MKCEDLLRHLRQFGCFLLREGGKHSLGPHSCNTGIFQNFRQASGSKLSLARCDGRIAEK